jgi:phage shock protein A
MEDEQIQEQISQYRMTAQSMGEAAREAVTRGDIGLARTIARQAAQHARIVVQLETGQKQFEPEESHGGPPIERAGEVWQT